MFWRLCRRTWRSRNSTALLHSFPYASFLAYSPRGTSGTSVQSQRICYSMKQDGRLSTGQPTIDYIVDRLANHHREEFAAFLGPERALVPVPKSAPLPRTGTAP